MKNKRGQVWVETVIYTLVAFTLMGLVLTFAKPKIEELQDKGIIEQSINIMQEIDSIINDIGSAGNQRVINIGISKGSITVDGTNDKIIFELASVYEYSEPGSDVQVGNLIVHNEKTGDINNLNMSMTYNHHNLQLNGEEISTKIGKSSTPYRLIITNKGLEEITGKKIINIEIIN
ncbi:MAG: hypothetical protein KKC19_02140 [Nanoarchaeota archaeon]|nr:hypothetical protein [Nanoarchaeota archaeon]